MEPLTHPYSHIFQEYLCVSNCLIYSVFEFFFEGFSVSFEGYVDSSFSNCLFLCLVLRYSPNDDDGNSASLLLDNSSLVIDRFLAFPSCFTSNDSGAYSWFPLKLFMVGFFFITRINITIVSKWINRRLNVCICTTLMLNIGI